MANGFEWLEALPLPVYLTDAEGRITFYNSAAATFWGRRPKLGTDQWCGSWRLYWPDGRPMPRDQCPMAVALKEGRPVRGEEAWAERPDGTRVLVLPYPTPLRDAAGRLTGGINLLMDVSARREWEIESERLAAIVASSDDAIVSKTLDGQITSWNGGATRMFGYETQEILGEPITRIIPPELQEEEKRIIATLRRGERIEHFETVRVRKDGRRIDVSLSVSPLHDRRGRVIGASKVARDITLRRKAEELQRLLIEELNHRVKNTLATMQAIANQSLRRAKSPAAFVAGFNGRVQALASAHTLLTRTAWQGADLQDLVSSQVMLGSDDHRISCSGPAVRLAPHLAVQLALVLNELGTNARKHGALSVHDGRLWVSWTLRADDGRELVLLWREKSGKPISAPAEPGFGSYLIEKTLRSCGGDVTIRYGADGMTCNMRLPLPETAICDIEDASRVAPGAPLLGSTGPPDRQGKRILVVEDEALLSMDVEESLTEAGCVVLGPAGTLEKAMQLATDEDCDAALIDANLGGRRVDELVAVLARRKVPFAFVTGYGRDALPHGLDDAILLGKPFSTQQLLVVVRTLLDRADGVAELRQRQG